VIVILFNSTVPPQRVTLPSQITTSSDPAAASTFQSFTLEIVIFPPLNVYIAPSIFAHVFHELAILTLVPVFFSRALISEDSFN
jgi:hypothetical protein